MTINLTNSPCTCPTGQCAAFVEPDTDCINRRAGVVKTTYCVQCAAHTWHEDGICLKCERTKRVEALGIAPAR